MIRLLKVLVSGGLIALLLWNIEWHKLQANLTQVNITVAVFTLVLLGLQYPLSAWKWQKSLRLHGVDYNLKYLLKILCIAFFFNNFLPTTIGGDAYRAYMTMDRAKRNAFPVSAVLLERLLGLIALLALGYVAAGILVFEGTLPYRSAFVWVSAIGFAGVLVGIMMLRLGTHRWLMEKLARIRQLEPLIESMRVIRSNRKHLAGLIFLSFLFQALAIFSIALLFSAIGVTGKFLESGVAAAAAGIAGMLPISINGIGVVESSFVVAAVLSKLPYEQAVIVTLFLRVFMLVSSVFFGVIYIVNQRGNGKIPEEGMIK